MAFTPLDWIPLILYFGLLVFYTLRKKYIQSDASETSYLLSGRKLTLPAFVATLVATLYGGILGVGEYTYVAGVSQWLLFAFPFYVFAILYALFLAKRVRENSALTIPEALHQRYGNTAGMLGAAGVFVLVSPAPYILMLGVLLQLITGSDSWLLYAVAVSLFSVIYVGAGGFASVVRTDWLQGILMYGGFVMILAFAWHQAGPPAELWAALPDSHTDITGGYHISYILVWFFIAMWTFVDPGFHQRSAAAQDAKTARNGILVSVVFWAIFDMLTLLTGLYAVVILGPGLENPVASFPELAGVLLPAGLLGLFITGLIAIIMSTMDSFLFLSGQTLGRDVLRRYSGRHPVQLTRIGIVVAALLSIALIYVFPSVIELWYVIGSLMIPAMLIPVLGAYLSPFRMRGPVVVISISGSFVIAFSWMVMGILTTDALYSYAWLGVEPFYPGLAFSVLVLACEKTTGRGKDR